MLPNHELAFEQFVLQNPASSAILVYDFPDLEVTTEGENYVIKNEITTLTLNANGAIVNWEHAGALVTENPIRPNLWRAPTDNDLGNGMHEWAKVWKDATEHAVPTLVEVPSSVGSRAHFSVEYTLPKDMAKLSVDYVLLCHGSLLVSVDFSANSDTLPNIPRLGMSMTLPTDYTDVSWYGRGPFETYWDRKTAGKIGVYEGKVVDQYHGYVRPQESGNKTDLRWMQVSSNKLNLRVESTEDELLNGSVWPFATSELDFVAGKDGGQSASGLVPVAAKHNTDIVVGKVVQWNIDYLQMGVGGDTSWGRLVHDEYTIPATKYSYSFLITPTKR
jgi:beta-galactosidase